MHQLRLVRDFGPDGAFIAAGFVRNRIWDALYPDAYIFPEADVDVVYFNTRRADKETDKAIEVQLTSHDSSAEWQVRNQAYMHHFGGHAPFFSLEDALLHWAETATGVGVRLDRQGKLQFVAPFGFDDLLAHILRITPTMKNTDPAGFDARLEAKGWLKRWPDLTVIT